MAPTRLVTQSCRIKDIRGRKQQRWPILPKFHGGTYFCMETPMSYPNKPQQPDPHGRHYPPPTQPTQPYQYGQPTAYGQPPQPPRRKGLSGWAITGIVVGAIVAVCMIGGVIVALASPDEDPTADPAADAPAAEGADDEPEEEPAAGIGDPVRDGKFEFVVTEIETGIESVGDEFLGKEAQGQFVFVHMTIENIGDEAQLFDGSSQYLFDAEGREHSSDGEAGFYVENSDSFLNEINPGNTVEGTVVFDIPADAVPASLRLHDSPFSGGVEVTVV